MVIRRHVVALLAVFAVIVGFTVGSTSLAGALSPVQEPAAPAAPFSLSAYQGYNSAQIEFVAGDGGSAAITNYKYSTDNGNSWAAFSPAVTTPPVTIGGLTNGTTYSVKLRAVNSVGDGAVSDAVSVTPAVVDAVTWTAGGAADASDWDSVTYGNGVFVAVASSGMNRVMTSPDRVTWTARTAAAANYWQSVTYGNGLFVAVASSGMNRVMTSPDGVTWTARTAAAKAWRSVTYGNGLFVAVASSGTYRVMTSPDGVTWTARTAAEANYWQSVTYGNGLFVAVASSGTYRVMTSPDGVTWTARTAAEANDWYSVTYLNGLFVAVSYDGTNTVMTSPFVELAAPAAPTSLVASPGPGSASITFAAGADGGAAITNYKYSTDNGATWITRSPSSTSSPLVISGLTIGTSYNVKLKAVNSVGDGTASTAVSVSPATVPAAPTHSTGYTGPQGAIWKSTAGDGSVSIDFIAGADGGAPITKYQFSTNDGSTWADAVGTTSPVTVNGLTNFTTYRIKLRAVNSVGFGAASATVLPWVTPVMAGPTLCPATLLPWNHIVACWNPFQPTATSVLTMRAYVYLPGTDTRVRGCVVAWPANSCLLGWLERGTTYDWRVQALVRIGPGRVFWTLFSPPQRFTTLP